MLREVARRAGVSHNAAYRHFSDRAALLAEVSDRAYADLEQAMLDRIATVAEGDPVERGFARLRETGRAYVDFAIRRAGPVHDRVHRRRESTEAPHQPPTS